MKFKLSYEQVLALYEFFTELLNKGNRMAFATMEARLCFLLLHSIYTKLHYHVLPAGAKAKPKYSLTLDEKEQLSFYLFFTQFPIPDHHPYAAILIQTICNEINEHYV